MEEPGEVETAAGENTNKVEEYPVSVVSNPTLGRYLIATRDVKFGEILLRDEPIFISPNAGDTAENNNDTCLGCCLRRKKKGNGNKDDDDDGDKLKGCGKCGWPVCGTECENNPNHALYECEIFSKNGIGPHLPSPYCFVAGAEFIKVLRCLLIKERDKDKWALMEGLEGHVEQRKSFPKLEFLAGLVKRFIKELCRMEHVPGETIDLILGIVDVNAFRHTVQPLNPLVKMKDQEVRDTVERNATFVYPKGSIAAHGCRRNVRWETLASGNLVMWASEDIKAGENLTHPYIDLMLGTPERRRTLKDLFYFDCSCPRCSDPTELGTNFSTLKCPECSTGDMLAESPLNYETSWKCLSCGLTKPGEYERDLVSKIRWEEKIVWEIETSEGPADPAVQENNGNGSLAMTVIGGYVKILSKYKGKLVHQNHYTMISVEYKLVHRLVKVKKQTQDLLHETRRMVKKYLDIMEVFYPGIK